MTTTSRPTVSRDRGKPRGLTHQRMFSRAGHDPLDEVEWERRSAVIGNDRGDVVFEQHDIEAPKNWSQHATNITANKYFRGTLGSPDREKSVRAMIQRVVRTVAGWAKQNRYFQTDAALAGFADDLTAILVGQRAAFNSPVWFNCGFEEKPQCSACFINSVEDRLESILELMKTEGMLFKFGSGTGTNLSPLRGSGENLRGGGTASGPVSFMRGYDAFAGVIKSGGKTRRAAKMVILNVDHPDIVEFINCKADEERKAWALIAGGYDGSFNGVAYGSVFFQNSNNSVRVTDAFMQAVADDAEWETRAVTDGQVTGTHRARDLLAAIAEATHVCGDPGLQFDTTINEWHTCPLTDRINSSNPCSEYMFLDDSACNLASLNLTRFERDGKAGTLDIERFESAVRTMFTAQEILVDGADYPTARIAENSHDFRPLGLGYASLGALLMAGGTPYDSTEGRRRAALVTAVMTGAAYAQSARIARDCGGPFNGYARNKPAFLRVMRKHHAAIGRVEGDGDAELERAAQRVWNDAIELGEAHGYRNAQATVLAPTGTIGLMMDCDTTGIEPDIGLVKRKHLVGGGQMTMINQMVPAALEGLGYSPAEVSRIIAHLDANETVEDAPDLMAEHLAVFDCAHKPANGRRFIHHLGHLKMIGAVQPFISGAISKTINMPEESTAEEIEAALIEAWRLGTKAVAIYRDGSKKAQPLSGGGKPGAGAADAPPGGPVRRRLPDERHSLTHKFEIAGHEGYITVGVYEDGTPGEIFLVMAKEGSTISGFADAFAQAISYTLQYGVPLQMLIDKFSHVRFEPAGLTKNSDIRFAKSIVDYLFRWLATKFLGGGHAFGPSAATDAATATQLTLGGDIGGEPSPRPAAADTADPTARAGIEYAIENRDAPPCNLCGAIMVRSGTCYKCLNCGNTSGCS